MRFKPILFIALGFGLLSLSHSLELRGDLAPFATSGVSPERATWHIMALVAVVGALGYFVAAGVSLFRTMRNLLR